MLSLPEKVLLILGTLASAYAAWRAADRIRRVIRRGHGQVSLPYAARRAAGALWKTVSQAPVLGARPLASLFHALVAWGFMFYLLVNIGDGLEALIPDFTFLGHTPVGNLYRLAADLLSVGVLAGMAALLIRRFVRRPPEITFRENVPLHPKARNGIRRDSAIVGGFILFHVGSRFLGASFHIAGHGPDAWQPFATAMSGLWAGFGPTAITVMQHVFFWGAIGTILLFVPYFPYTKHIHIFFAPINFFFKPERRSMGQLDAIDFDDESVTQYGAARLEDLSWPQVMDAWACIMCNRCQEACPAYATGKVLSPAALEVSKRYQIKDEYLSLAAGEPSKLPLTEFAISPEAAWACTTCGACVEICPVGNEPMRDILDIRRNLVLMENVFPDQLQTAYRGMERTANPWNIPPESRLAWAEGLTVPTVDQNPQPEVLWWVGCAPSTDARAQKTARDFAKILNSAGVNYAVLGKRERCTGDSARRSGNEFLFTQLATQNVETLNEVAPKRIVTTCPHCLHTLKNEYGAFGGHYEVIHHTQLIGQMVDAGRLKLNASADGAGQTAFHDPCYLGRHNGEYDAPREALKDAGAELIELPRNRNRSFCCGAGGAQMWKEEEHGIEHVNEARFREAAQSGAKTLAVGCPFCMVMMTDAARAAGSDMQVRDVAEVVAERLCDE